MSNQLSTKNDTIGVFPKMLYYFGGLLSLSFLLWVEVERVAAADPNWWTTDMALVALMGMGAMGVSVALMALNDIYINGKHLFAKIRN